MRFVRWWLAAVIAVGLTFAGAPAAVAGDATAGTGSGRPVLRGIDLERATVLDLQRAMDGGGSSAVQLTAFYLHRIRTVDPLLHSVIETNPHALRDGRRERRAAARRGGRSALEGIPVLLKDNVDTDDRQHTTAGSFALSAPGRRATRSS